MKRWLQLAVSLLITLASFWWTFKDANVAELWGSLRSANWLWLVPYLGILAIIHVCRTLRWGNLLSGIEKVPFKPLNEAAAIGFMMLLVLPFRLGEFARPFLIAQRAQKIRRSAAMTTVVLERIVDGIVIAVLLRVLLFFVPGGETPELSRIRWGGNVMFLVFFSGFLFLLIARWQHDPVIGLIRKTAGRVAPAIAEKIVNIVDGFVSALKQLPDTANLVFFFVWTAVYWALNGLGMWVLAMAFDCSHATEGVACQPLVINVFASFVVLSVLIIGLMIPAAPGAAGTFQAFVKLGLAVFVPPAVVNGSGVAFANVLWVVQILQQVLTGLFFLVLSHGSFSDIAGKLNAQGSTGEQSAHKPGEKPPDQPSA